VKSIGLLSKGIRKFQQPAERTTERFDRLTEIQDMQKLRKQIALECQEFRRIVEENKGRTKQLLPAESTHRNTFKAVSNRLAKKRPSMD